MSMTRNLFSIRMLKYFSVCLVMGTLALGVAISHPIPDKVDFRRDVQPLLKQYCIECHGPSQQMHGFRLDRRRDAMRGGTVVMIKPGNGEASLLYLKLIGSQYGPQMPLTGPLNQEQINILKAWIDQGAEWPDEFAGDTPSPAPDPKATRIMDFLRSGDRQSFIKLASDPKIGDRKGPGGATPLMQAVLYGEPDDVRLLLQKGADPNIRNDAGATALMWAMGDPEKTRLLLEHGADVNARSEDSRTPLLIAAGQFGASETVKLLLERGASLSTKSPNPTGYSTPLAEAAFAGDETLLHTLIDKGADVKGSGPVMLLNAMRARCKPCLDTLLVNPDRRALTSAAVQLCPPRGDARVLKELIDRGADVNARDGLGNTLLMLAASSDGILTDTVKTLVDHGADLNATNPNGETALDLAKLRGRTPVVDLLANAGAKTGTVSADPIATARPAGSVRAAIERSIPLLQKTDSIFLQKAGCVSCHHNGLTAISMATARSHGFKVDDQMTRTSLKALDSYIESWRERALQGVGIPGNANTMSSILLGLGAANYPPDPATDAMARLLKSRQSPEGKWRAFSHRPPMEASDISVTADSLRALQIYAPKAQRARYELTLKRAADWLIKAKPETVPERSMQLLGLGWTGLRAQNVTLRKFISELLREQRPDGGWAQLSTLESDPYATGQALVALREAGGLAVTSLAYRRGVRFLLNTQREDGSWYVRTRAIPLQPYFESGFPYGRDQWISAAATNWATMALALTGKST